MSDFMRPEARALLWRWREVLYAAVIALFGLWWVWGGIGIVKWIGLIILAIAAILALAGIQRGRFRQSGKGPGVVQVAERRLAYFGPLEGGTMDIADLTRLDLDPTSYPAPSWRLTGIGGQSLAIPVNADGAEARGHPDTSDAGCAVTHTFCAGASLGENHPAAALTPVDFDCTDTPLTL